MTCEYIAYPGVTYFCAKCPMAMWIEDDVIECINSECEIYGKKFNRPSVELEEITIKP